MLTECMIYLAVSSVLLGLAFAAFYRVMDNAKGLRRNAAEITRVLQAGERWREDIHRATGPLRLVGMAGAVEQAFHVPQQAGEVVYFFTGTNMLRRANPDAPWIETLAAAEKQRLIAEAEGHASSIRAQGEAEAEIIFKKGEAEAKAMNVKAEAFQEYNQAAVIDKLFASMPEIVRALAAPLANVDKITVVSTGNGSSAGLNKITGDITQMAAQIPALFETLSGMPLSDLLGKVRQIGDKAAKPENGKSK